MVVLRERFHAYLQLPKWEREAIDNDRVLPMPELMDMLTRIPEIMSERAAPRSLVS